MLTVLAKESQEKKLTDTYQRHIHKLRVQLTDACNFRCFYCMPENIKFKNKSELLSVTDIFNICSVLNKLGIDEIRVTGGEPTIRDEFEEIMTKLSSLPLKKLALTTNGFNLEKKLLFLKTTNCKNINISLDSLQPDKFKRITKSNYFYETYTAILKAKEMGFNVKVNTILFRGINDDEVFDFLTFSAANDIEVRFLELMKIGPAYEMNPLLFIPAAETIKKIKTKEKLTREKVSIDSTSFNYTTPSGAKIGFIASESKPFCGSCSRLRLSATGKLRACLMSEAGLDLRDKDENEYREILYSVMGMKPPGRIHHIEQPMNQIGG
jgi:cyclic pyranopterin phosphate synthase